MSFKVIWFLMVVINGTEYTSQMFQTKADCLAVARYWERTDARAARCTDDPAEAWEGISGRRAK